MDNDIKVIRRVLGGDTESFRQVVQRYQRPVISMVRNLISDTHLAEDVAQEVFLSAFKKLDTFDAARSRFSTWLFTITRNTSINVLRKKKPVPQETLPEQSDHRSPDSPSMESEFYRRLDEELDNLMVTQKTAFILTELEGISYEEAAQIEGVSLGTIKSRVFRAKKNLRAALKGYKGE